MNRAQRRAQGKVEMIDLRTLVPPQELSPEERKFFVRMRMTDNCTTAGHPYHHKTASGVVVETDPTLEYQLQQLDKLSAYQEFMVALRASAEGWIQDHPTAALPTVPVNRTFYGVDPYKQQ